MATFIQNNNKTDTRQVSMKTEGLDLNLEHYYKHANNLKQFVNM